MLDKIQENPKLKDVKIVVVGSGYVGLPLAVLRALQGAKVAVVDIDKKKIDSLKAGKPPFYEEGLPELLSEAIERKRISFHTNLSSLVKSANVIYSCVGTPQRRDGSANLIAIKDVGQKVGKGVLANQKLLVIQASTVPPGTTMGLYEDIVANSKLKKSQLKIVVSDRPEFLQQGRAFEDNINYDRKVAGLYPNRKWAENLLRLVEETNPEAPFVIMPDLQSAEITKYAANSFLATKISFANEIAEWCDLVGADVRAVMDGVGLDDRICNRFFGAGLGWSGGCFPKDVSAAEFDIGIHGGASIMLSATIKRNERQIALFLKKIEEYFGGNLKRRVIAAGGVAFKPTTDFVYPSQSVRVIERLVAQGATVKVYDPIALDNFKKLEVGKLSGVEIVDSVSKMLKDAEAFTLLTEWDEFKEMDLTKAKKLMKNPVIFDGRNAYNPDSVKEAGFEYLGVGRN